MVRDATADYSDEEMHAALDVTIPNYASAIVTTEEIVASLASLYSSGVYQRRLPPDQHRVGKLSMQKMERKHLTLRTRLNRLARKTCVFPLVCHARPRQRVIYEPQEFGFTA